MSETLPQWDVLQTTEVGDFEAFRVLQVRAQRQDDAAQFNFHIVERNPCVQVIPVLSDGRMLMVEQYRHGMQGLSLEFPAGVLEPGEDPVHGGLRELEEETGYRAARHYVLGELEPDTAIIRSPLTLVVALDCEPTGKQQLDPAERVRIRVVSAEEIDRLIACGEIRLASTIAAWHLYRSRG